MGDLTSGQLSQPAAALPHRSHLLLVRITRIMFSQEQSQQSLVIDQSVSPTTLARNQLPTNEIGPSEMVMMALKQLAGTE